MGNFLLKIKLIYLQFLLVSISFICIYSLLIWLVVYRFNLIALNEDLITIWLPIVFPGLLYYLFLRPRVKILNLKSKNDNLPFFYFIVALFAIAAPTIVLQQYLPTATGKLTSLQNINQINQINQNPHTKYYTLTNHHIDKFRATAHRRTEVSGRNSEYLTFHYYIACPILVDDKIPDTVNKFSLKTPVAWLGTEYTRGLSNHLRDTEKESIYKEFGTETYNRFKEQNLDDFIYLDRIGNNDKHKGYKAAIRTEPQYDNTEPIILEAKHEPFDQRNGDEFEWIFKTFGIGAGIWFIMLIFPKVNMAQISKLPDYSLSKQWQSFYYAISRIKLRDGNLSVTAGIIGLNLLVFIIMVSSGLGFISFDGHDLYNWGANTRPAVINGQWWRLLTNIFLHGGLMHILFNMYGLFFVAIFLEPLLGRVKFITAYLCCGLMASLASIWWHPLTLSVGASGAIFGLYGVLTALLTTNKADASSKKMLLLNNAIFIGLNLILGLSGGIDNAAHIGGLISGFALGYIYYFFIDAPKPKRVYKKRVKKISES